MVADNSRVVRHAGQRYSFLLLVLCCIPAAEGFAQAGALKLRHRVFIPRNPTEEAKKHVWAPIPLRHRQAKILKMTAPDSDTWVRPAPRGKRDIIFGTRITSNYPVAPKHDEGCTLGAYMLLPTDQYVLMPLPNGAKLEKKSDNLFNLIVPELQIFSVWLRPHVVSRVDVTPAGVIIEAVECRLDGSPEVQRLDLNSKFELSVKVVLEGIKDPRGLRSVINCRSEISVWVDPPQIFRMMFPKPLMVETGNAVVRSTLRLLQTTFLQGLAADYNRWASDEKYRSKRAASSAVSMN